MRNRRSGIAPRSFDRLESRVILSTLPPGFAESPIAVGLNGPTAMDLAPDGRLWVLEQQGVVKVFGPGGTTGSVALTISPSALDHSGERGLLGIAFDPNYDVASPAPDFVYLYYTSTAGASTHNRISRFVVDNANPDRPTLSGETDLVDLDPLSAATNHNGGAIHFGPDGKLYVGVGDNAQGSNAQSLTTRLGKILRYNPDGSIPVDNPSSFSGISGVTSGADRAIWAVGFRNPFTFTFDPGSGRMFVDDVGLNTFEEIDDGKAGANYGWPVTEGDFSQSSFPAFTRPVYAYSHGTGLFQGFAITGGAFYDPTSPGPSRFPDSFRGDYFFADFSGNWINVLDPSTGSVARFATGAPGPVDLEVAPDGALDYLSRGSGEVFQVAYTANPPPHPPTTPPASFDGSGRTDLAVYLPASGSFAYRPTDGSADRIIPFGIPGPGATIPASADYAGSGRTEIAAYLPSVGAYAIRPSSGPDQVVSFGIAGPGQSIPVPADYDGDGKADVAVYLPSLGAFGIRPSAGGPDWVVAMGPAGSGRSIPAPGDYFGSGKASLAVYLPAAGAFAIRPETGPDLVIPFGLAGAGRSIPIPGDYDGSGRTEIAAYFPEFGIFAYRPALGGPDVLIAFGAAGDGTIPVPGDYSGSGEAEIAVYDPNYGSFAFRPAGGGPDVIQGFGSAGPGQSIPLAAAVGVVRRLQPGASGLDPGDSGDADALREDHPKPDRPGPRDHDGSKTGPNRRGRGLGILAALKSIGNGRRWIRTSDFHRVRMAL